MRGTYVTSMVWVCFGGRLLTNTLELLTHRSIKTLITSYSAPKKYDYNNFLARITQLANAGFECSFGIDTKCLHHFQILCCENRKYVETVSAFDHPPARIMAARS